MTPRELVDGEGENRAVRAFLALYGGTAGVSVGAMRAHLRAMGFDGCWPAWAEAEAGHLTKAGAQLWIRHLIRLEDRLRPEGERATALRMADTFDGFSKSSHRWEDGTPLHEAVAAELRRLHAFGREGWRYAAELEEEIRRMRGAP